MSVALVANPLNGGYLIHIFFVNLLILKHAINITVKVSLSGGRSAFYKQTSLVPVLIVFCFLYARRLGFP